MQILGHFNVYVKGHYNPCVLIAGYTRPFRYKSEMIVMRGDKILLALDGEDYKIPGGAIETFDSDVVAAAIRETKEEVGLVVKNCQAYGTRVQVLNNPVPWVREHIPLINQWTGYYSHIVIGEYAHKWAGPLAPDAFASEVQFYDIAEVFNILVPEHKDAVRKYILWRDGKELQL